MDWVELGWVELDWTEPGLDQRLGWRWGGQERKRLREFGFGPGLSLTLCSTGEDGIGFEWIDLEWVGGWIGHWARDCIGLDWIGLDLDLGLGKDGALIKMERAGEDCLATMRFIFEGSG